MIRNFKMFLFVLIAWWVMIIPDVLIRYYSEVKSFGISYAYPYVIQALFYSIPIILLSFGIVFCFNLLMQHKLNSKDQKKWNRDYKLFGLLFVITIPIMLIAFEYTQRGRYFDNSDFYRRIYSYIFLIGFGLVLLIINKKLFWKFKSQGS